MASRNVLGIAFDFCGSETKGARKFGAASLSRYLYERNARRFYFGASLGILPVALLFGLNWRCARWGW